MLPSLESHFQPKFVNMLGGALEKYTTTKDFSEFQTQTEVQVNQLVEKTASNTSEIVNVTTRFTDKTEMLRTNLLDLKDQFQRDLRDQINQTKKWVD